MPKTATIHVRMDELMQNASAYHVEQAVEKIMKALIIKADHDEIKEIITLTEN